MGWDGRWRWRGGGYKVWDCEMRVASKVCTGFSMRNVRSLGSGLVEGGMRVAGKI